MAARSDLSFLPWGHPGIEGHVAGRSKGAGSWEGSTDELAIFGPLRVWRERRGLFGRRSLRGRLFSRGQGRFGG